MALKQGTQFNDFLNGSDDNDMFAGLGGNDTLNGSAGTDMAWYSGNMAGYSFANVGGRLVVRDTLAADGSDGTDNLGQIETLQFGNGQLKITGTEFLVNSAKGNDQSDPTITALTDGGFVVSWTGQDGSGKGIYAQRYNAAGVASGAEFLVNSATGNDQSDPTITALADGGFVVSWTGQDGSEQGIYAQLYNAAGVASGAEFLVNSYTTSAQHSPTITALTNGGFVVSWTYYDSDGQGIYAQRYNASGVASGAEFRVNSYTTNDQRSPTIAALTNGGFVVSWLSGGQDGSGHGIYAQRYNAAGVASGAEFRVNSYTTNHQYDPTVTSLTDGGFVVSWASQGQDGSDWGVYAQRFDASGAASGAEFQINSYTTNTQNFPSITVLTDGGFVVSWWSSAGQDRPSGIYAQRYDATGVALGAEFRVNSYTTNDLNYPSITALTDGGFVVSWTGQDDSGKGIYAQRYDANGHPVGLNLKLTGSSGADIINLDPGQLLTVDGAGGNDTINGSSGDDLILGGTGNDSLTGNAGSDYLDGGAGNDRMAGGLGDDDFYVDSVGDVLTETIGAGNDSVFSSVAWTLAANFENLTLTGTGSINGNGNAQGNLLSGNSGNNILDGKAGADLMAGGIGNDTYVVDNILDVISENTASGTDLVQTSVTYSLGDNLEKLTLTGTAAINGFGNELANIMTGNGVANLLKGEADNDALSGLAGNDWLFGGLGADILTGGLGTDTFRFDTAFSADNADLVMDFVHGTDKISILPNLVGSAGSHGVLSASDFTATAGLLAGDTHRIIYNVSTGGLYDNADGAGSGGEALIATFQGKPALSASDIYLSTGTPGDDTLNGGDGMDMAWYSGNMAGYSFANVGGRLVVRDTNAADGQDGTDNLGQIETLQFASGQMSITASSDFQVNTYTTDIQVDPTVTALTDGGFVVSWYSGGQDGSEFGIYAQRYNTAGQAAGSEFQVNTYTTNAQSFPAIAALTDGGFVISWYSGGQDADRYGIYGQRYDEAGVALGSEFLVNTYTTDYLNMHTITALADGGFVVSWELYIQDGAGSGIYAQRYNAAGAMAGLEFRVNTTTTNFPIYPTITALTDGGFVVSWTSDGQDGDRYGIYGQRYDEAGVALGSEFRVNTYTTGNQDSPSITALTDGGFVVSWQSYGQDGSEYGIYAQRYDAAGLAAGSEFRVNTYTTMGQDRAEISALTDGSFVVGWSSGGQDGSAYGVYAQRYDAAGVAAGAEFRVNTYTTMGQASPTIAALADGGFVVSWHSYGQDGSSVGIYAQRYDAKGNPMAVVFTLTGTAGADTINLDPGQLLTVDGAGSNDILNGSSGDDMLLGGTGNDKLTGNAGNDRLDGGTGIDTMIGGMGDDNYTVGILGDVLTEAAGAGNDSVFSLVSWTLAANFENLTLTGYGNINGTGNTFGNLLTGNSGNNILDGGASADILAGGLGDDTYLVDNIYDYVSEDAGSGTDLIKTSVTFTLGNNIENLTLTGTAAINGTGNTLGNILLGNSGANILDGGAGADAMTGGLGNDTYIVDNFGDVITENAAAGTDTVQSNISYALGANLENLTLIGSATIDGIGNALSNILTGNNGNNILDGGLGNDTYVVGTGDTVIESNALPAEIDTVQANVSFTLGNNLENLTLTGSTNINGTGNDLKNTLIGNSGANRLDGGGLGDSMVGGDGNDTYVVDNIADVVTESNNQLTQIDTVEAGIRYTLGNNVENLLLTGAANINGTGNILNNTLTGNSGANTLNGGTGNDFLNGALGNDTLTGGVGNDTFVFDTAPDATNNKDTLSDFVAGLDKIQLDKDIFASLTDMGSLLVDYFRSNSTGLASDANDYFLYSTTTGALSYDADGSGVGLAIQFATLTTKPAITASDFLVVA